MEERTMSKRDYERYVDMENLFYKEYSVKLHNRYEQWKKFFRSIKPSELKKIKLQITIPRMSRQEVIELAASVGRNIDLPNIKINVENVD